MKLTENQASGRWCPFARPTSSTSADDGGTNRTTKGQAKANSTCIGTSCMAWRWAPLPPECDTSDPGFHRPGYCGLAGQP